MGTCIQVACVSEGKLWDLEGIWNCEPIILNTNYT